MRKLDERVKNAISMDASIVVSRDSIESAEGRSEEQLGNLGLSRTDLKWLERKGLAVRAYTSNGGIIYMDKEGKMLPRPLRRYLSGRRVRWILLSETP